MQKICFLLPFALLLTGCGIPKPRGLAVRVIDTEVQPVRYAVVRVGWSWRKINDAFPDAGTGHGHHLGITDENGNYTYFGVTRGSLGASASKDGYYSGRADNAMKIMLRRKQNPAAMYAKEVSCKLPSDTGDFGYDLFVGDLVAPHGKGAHPDFILRVKPTNFVYQGVNFHRLNLDVVFPNPSDGIQAFYMPSRTFITPSSDYSFPFSAPRDGYLPSLSAANGDTPERYEAVRPKYGMPPPGQADFDRLPKLWYWIDDYQFREPRDHVWSEEVNYFFKVRSGDAGKGCYGMIWHRIEGNYHGTKTPNVSFQYYVNPDGTQNIEYDPAQNLINNISRFEDKARIPY